MTLQTKPPHYTSERDPFSQFTITDMGETVYTEPQAVSNRLKVEALQYMGVQTVKGLGKLLYGSAMAMAVMVESLEPRTVEVGQGRDSLGHYV